MKKFVKIIALAMLLLVSTNVHSQTIPGKTGVQNVPNAETIEVLKATQSFFDFHFQLNFGQLLQTYLSGEATIEKEGDTYTVELRGCIITVIISDL